MFIGISRGEEFSGTLHLLFTTLHPSGVSCANSLSGLQILQNRVVKSGEEWVKSEQKLFTTPNALFIGIYKGKVKSEEFLALRRNKKYNE